MVSAPRKTSAAGSLRDSIGQPNGLAPLGSDGKVAMSLVSGLITALAAKATPADIGNAIAALVASSPATLDTLDELAAALGDDPNFATTMATALGNRLRFDAAQTLSGPQRAQGRANLGVSTADLDALYTRLNGAANIDILKSNPVVSLRASDTSSPYYRLINSAGAYDITLNASGDLIFANNTGGAAASENMPLVLTTAGVPAFGVRPTFGGVGLATLSEVGSGGTSGVASFNGRSGIVVPANNDYTSAQIQHAGGSLATELADKQQLLSKVGGAELGSQLTGDRNSFLDLHSHDGVDYSARVARNPGVNGRMDFLQTGTGGFGFYINGVETVVFFDTLDGGAI